MPEQPIDEQRPLGPPVVVWKSIIAGVSLVLVILSFLVIVAIITHHITLVQVADIVSLALLLLIGIVVVVLLVRAAVWTREKGYEHGLLKNKLARTTLQNDLLAQQVRMMEQSPILLKYAVDAGHNVELTAKGEIRITAWQSNIHAIRGQEALSAPDYVPPPFKFSELLRNWQPTKDGILLAAKEATILAPIGEPLCHTTFTGATNSGKSNNQRLLLLQLLFLGQTVYLADRNYQSLRQDKRTGEVYDYRPIESQLALEPVTAAKETLAMLKYLVSELDNRRIARRKAVVSFPDMYLFIDELPAFCVEEPDIMAYVGRIVREARQYGIFFIGAAQDLLNQTLKNDNGAIRENLLTNFYGGGDATTARLVLNLPRGEALDESGLGKQGVVYLRAAGIGLEHAKVRTPLCDDAATHILLGDMSPREKQAPLVVDAVPATGEEMVTPGPSELTGDLRRVYEACQSLASSGQRVSSRNVEALTGIDKDKANNLMNRLMHMGFITR